jgi:hypothetical protein
MALSSVFIYIHTYNIPLTLYPQRYSSETLRFYQNDLTIRNTLDVTGGKLIAVWSQSISGVTAVGPLVAFNDISGRRVAIPFFCPENYTALYLFIIIFY